MADNGSDGNSPLARMVAKIKKGNPALTDAQAESMAMRALKRMQGGASND
jgi:hypothetical protein